MAARFEYYITGDDGFNNAWGVNWFFQTFTPTTAHKITSVKLLLFRAGSPGTITVSIRATDGSGLPTGSDLCSGTIDGNSLTTNTAGAWYEITFGAGYDLAASTKYAIVVRATGGSSGNDVRWRYDTTSPTYAGGNAGYSSNSGSSWTAWSTYDFMFEEWGTADLVISPSGLSQPISYGTPKLNLSIKPPGHQQVIAYGTPTVQTAGLIIYPSGLQVVIAYGTPSLRYPQTISPSGLSVPIAYGTPSIVIMGEGVIYVPGHQQPIAYGTPSLLKYVWHAILDGRYSTGTLEVNRAYVIGRDVYGNPIYGTAVDSDELGLVGERLDFQQELAIPTETQAQEVANAILSKMGLTGKSGVILIPPNCGQELFDVVQVTDSRGNQSATKYRVVGLRFEYNPRQARYHHKLILGGT